MGAKTFSFLWLGPLSIFPTNFFFVAFFLGYRFCIKQVESKNIPLSMIGSTCHNLKSPLSSMGCGLESSIVFLQLRIFVFISSFLWPTLGRLSVKVQIYSRRPLNLEMLYISSCICVCICNCIYNHPYHQHHLVHPVLQIATFKGAPASNATPWLISSWLAEREWWYVQNYKIKPCFCHI